jgi:hypothetical protein
MTITTSTAPAVFFLLAGGLRLLLPRRIIIPPIEVCYFISMWTTRQI